MKRGIVTKIRNLLKGLEFDKDSIELMVDVLKSADNKKLDPFHFDLKHSLLLPLEEKFPYPYREMRRLIDNQIHPSWEKLRDRYEELGFSSRPTVKGFISLLLLKLQKDEI